MTAACQICVDLINSFAAAFSATNVKPGKVVATSGGTQMARAPNGRILPGNISCAKDRYAARNAQTPHWPRRLVFSVKQFCHKTVMPKG